MDVERLRLLRELAERGTVHAAARAMSLTPSAVSQQLKILQREAGVALLEPDGRRVRLTDAGRILVARTDEVLAALDRATAEMASYRTTARGSVRVAMFPSGAAMFLAGLITAAATIGVEVLGSDIDQPAANAPALLADFDVVVVHRDDRDSTNLSPRVEEHFLLREPLEILLPPGHRLAGRRRVALRDLTDESWIGVEGGLVVDDVLRSLAAVTGVRPRIVQRVNDFRVVEELVLAGVGVALMPRYSLTVRELVRKPLAGVVAARRIEAVTRTGGTARPAIAAVIDILGDLARRMSEPEPSVDGCAPIGVSKLPAGSTAAPTNPKRRAQMTDDVKFLELNGDQVAYRDAGSGDEVLLLIHGMAGSSEAWRDLIPRLAKNYRVVAPDLLGHGQSTKPRGDYSLGAFAVWLRDFLDELGIARATIVGHSLGGGVAMQFIYQHPDYCERLILISSGGLGPDVGFILRLLSAPGAEFVLPIIAPSPVLKAGNKIGSWFTSSGMRNPRASEIWRAYSSFSDAPTRDAFLRTLRSVVDYRGQSVSALNRLHVRSELPTLAIWGADDQIIPVEHGHAALAARPGSRLEVLPGVGHFAHVEAPTEVADIIVDFMTNTKNLGGDEAPVLNPLTGEERP